MCFNNIFCVGTAKFLSLKTFPSYIRKYEIQKNNKLSNLKCDIKFEFCLYFKVFGNLMPF